jgi:hypothetical protein
MAWLVETRPGQRVLGLLLMVGGALLIAITDLLLIRTDTAPTLALGAGGFALGLGLGTLIAPGRQRADGTVERPGCLPLLLGVVGLAVGVWYLMRP